MLRQEALHVTYKKRTLCAAAGVDGSRSGLFRGNSNRNRRGTEIGNLRFQKLKVYKSSGDNYIPVFEGETHTGVHITLHETDLAPGAVAHPPHHHSGEEIFMVREGTLEVEIEGKRSQVSPGSVAYIASNAEHALRNTSKDWTRYFVFLLGSEAS